MNYHIARDGQQYGNLSESEIRSRLASGELRPTDLCWTEGMSEWKPLGQILSAAPAASAFPAPVSAPANPYAPPVADIRNQAGRRTLATLGQRFGAAMLDGLIAIVLCIPMFIAMPLIQPGPDGEPSFPPLAIGLMGISGLLLVILAIYTIYLLSVQGQSLGKKILGIRIVNNLDDSNAGFVRAFLLRAVVNAIPGAIIPFYGLIDICFIFNSERRCIHDFIGGTRVIQD